ncbi:hypothetical protein UVI_02059000 [Ustilaginoidea virens]|uniref:Uncharacterized protein n=1 Tax=Ustilaginoidea virens TaxID=1159556 RepID=A0A1B5L584_USTVR|nr:hypothetical protein UVI_02059000 [Ustilaginoidea virens]
MTSLMLISVRVKVQPSVTAGIFWSARWLVAKGMRRLMLDTERLLLLLADGDDLVVGDSLQMSDTLAPLYSPESPPKDAVFRIAIDMDNWM